MGCRTPVILRGWEGGGLGFLRCLFFPLSQCCTSGVKGGASVLFVRPPRVFCLVTVTCRCGGFCKEDVRPSWTASSPLRLSSRRLRCSFQKSLHISLLVPPGLTSLSSSPLWNQVTRKYAISHTHTHILNLQKSPKTLKMGGLPVYLWNFRGRKGAPVATILRQDPFKAVMLAHQY